MHIRRKYRVGVFIDRNSRVCPPQEGLRHICAVIELAFDLNVSFIRIQGKGAHAFGAVHLVNLTDIDGGGTILVFLIEIVYRRIGGRAVMLRPVELDPAGDPGAGKAYQGRFDHMVIIDKIIVVCLIVCPLDTAADLWQDHNLEIIILQVNGMIIHIFFCV